MDFIYIDNNLEILEKILEIGEIIENNINIKSFDDKDLTKWNHKKKNKSSQLLIVEYENINKIQNTLLENKIQNFLNKYKYNLFDAQERNKINDKFFLANPYFRSNKFNREILLKIISHISYVIYKVSSIISAKNSNFDFPIILKSYRIVFNVKTQESFVNKTYALLYNLLNTCYTKEISCFIDLDEKEQTSITIKYYTKFLSTYLFYELYKIVKTSQMHTIGKGYFKSCDQCGILFYNNRKNAKNCGSEWCKLKRNSQYVKKNYWKSKSS